MAKAVGWLACMGCSPRKSKVQFSLKCSCVKKRRKYKNNSSNDGKPKITTAAPEVNYCWDSVRMGSIRAWLSTEQDVLLKTPLFRTWLKYEYDFLLKTFSWNIIVRMSGHWSYFWHVIPCIVTLMNRSYKYNSVGLKSDDTITFSVERYWSSTWDVLYVIRYITIDNSS